MSDCDVEIMESMEQMYGPGAEQICSECAYAPLCHFHKTNSRIMGCTHYYGKTSTTC